MEIAAEYLDRGYHVYLYPQIYRYPNDPKLYKLKYIPDLLVIKNDEYIIIEIGFCSKKKLLDLRQLVPSAKIMHVTQWKNFFSIDSLKPIPGYALQGPPKRTVVFHRWTSDENKQIIAVCEKPVGYWDVALLFPNLTRHCLFDHIRRLHLKGLLRYRPSSKQGNVWIEEENKKLIDLYNQGVKLPALKKYFPDRTYGSLNRQIQVLHNQGRIVMRCELRAWDEAQDNLLISLWSERKTIQQIQLVFPARTIYSITGSVNSMGDKSPC